MKNWTLLMMALLLGGLGAWGLTSLFAGDSPEIDKGVADGALDLQGPAGGESESGKHETGSTGAAQSSKDKPAGSSANGLPVGRTWNPKNPWFKTRGIGRRTSPSSKGAVVFPDGTWLPVLNGVENAPPFPGFSSGYPYAPVVKIVRSDDGTQWYIHADGTRSSPQNMKYGEGGKDLGTRPGWAVGNPYETKPVVGPDGKTRYEPRESGKPKVRTGPGG